MKTLKMMGLVSLVLGFLWLGVPRCSDVDYLDKQERGWVEILCRQVRSKYFFEPNPQAMTADEWRSAVRSYRAADNVPEADAVLRRLADRLRGR